MSDSGAKGGVEQPTSFTFDADNSAKVDAIIAKYPTGRQASAVLPLLDLAQRQHGGWIPSAAVEHVAGLLDMPVIRVWEVVTFYTMYNTKPFGEHRVHVCTTTPCWLRGSDDITAACERKLGITFGETTEDGKFSLHEIECGGACVNAPLVQINDDYYEDLDAASIEAVLDTLMRGEAPTVGSQTGRLGAAPASGPKTLLASGGDD